MIQARRTAPFTSLADFADRIDLRLCNKRVLESLVAAGALEELGGHRAQLTAALDDALREAQLLQQEREAGQASLFGEGGSASRPRHAALPDLPPWSEQERLAKEKEVLGFFISGHPLERFRTEVELFGSRTTGTLSEWSEHQVSIAAVVTQVKRQISKKSGKEYARLLLEDFHGTAEAIVFPEAWSKLNQVIRADLPVLLSGGYSPRDRGEDRAPFVVEGARPLEEMMASGAVALALRWKLPQAPTPDLLRQAAALLSAHPGPVPLYIEWSDGNGERLRARARRVRVAPSSDLLSALRQLLGPESVLFVRVG
jgi:DNA polymerase-3 subunit alpha